MSRGRSPGPLRSCHTADQLTQINGQHALGRRREHDVHASGLSPLYDVKFTAGALRTAEIELYLSRNRDGGARRDRTDDLMLAKHALSQLSYGPVTRRRMLTR